MTRRCFEEMQMSATIASVHSDACRDPIEDTRDNASNDYQRLKKHNQNELNIRRLNEQPLMKHLTKKQSCIHRFICPHLRVSAVEKRNAALDETKSEFLVYLARRLIATSTGKFEVGDWDELPPLQIHTPGNFYLMVLKDRLERDLIRKKAK